MAKEIKTGKDAARYESEKIAVDVAEIIAARGDELGNIIIELMPLNDVDRIRLAVVAVGLAKAVATLKGIAKETGVSADKLYETELEYFLREFEKK